MKHGSSQQVWLSIGSNRGERTRNVQAVVNSLSQHPDLRLRAVSSVYETAPWGEIKQSAFYNAIVEIGTALEPLELLNTVKLMERQLGREAGPRWGPRVIDIDIVLWEDAVVDTTALTIPHLHFRERAFVLVPLCELAPKLIDPVSGATVEALLAQVAGKDGVMRVETSLHIPSSIVTAE